MRGNEAGRTVVQPWWYVEKERLNRAHWTWGIYVKRAVMRTGISLNSEYVLLKYPH